MTVRETPVPPLATATTKPIGIRDVARLAGVSVASASLALNGQPGVADVTRRRIAAAADQLGYRASAHVTPSTGAGFGEWNNTTADSKARVSAVLTGWTADYPNPIDFLDLLLSCKSFVPGSPTNLNTAELCDPRLDSLITQAEAIQVRNPAEGARRWQEADRRAVDLAPWAPLLNPVGSDVVSDRTGNYQHNPEWSVLLDQLWVR